MMAAVSGSITEILLILLLCCGISSIRQNSKLFIIIQNFISSSFFSLVSCLIRYSRLMASSFVAKPS